MDFCMNATFSLPNNHRAEHLSANYFNQNEFNLSIPFTLSTEKITNFTPCPSYSGQHGSLDTINNYQNIIFLDKFVKDNKFTQLSITQEIKNDLISKMMRIKSSSELNNNDDCPNVFSLLNINLNSQYPSLNVNMPRKHISKNYFTKEEDDKIKKLVKQFGTGCWPIIASFMNGRTPKQCRDRYSHYLFPGIFQGEWSNEEDELLIKKYKELGPKWSYIQNYFPNRNAISIKNRWNYLLHQKCKHERDNKENFISKNEILVPKSNIMNNNVKVIRYTPKEQTK